VSDNHGIGLRQPWTGILGTAVSVILAFCIILWFKPATFMSWVAFLVIATVPIGLIMSLVWQTKYPKPAATLEQPLKGLYLLAFMLIIGFIVAAVSFAVGGKFVSPPGMYLIFYIITSVIAAFWLIIVFQCWPCAAIKKHPAFVGLGTLVLIYIVGHVINLFYNYGFLQGMPAYMPQLDPGGPFMAVNALTFMVSTVPCIVLLVLFDFWPVSLIAKKVPSLGKQPVFGILAGIWVVILSWIMWAIFVNGAHMEVMLYLVNIAVMFLFGQVIMLLMMQTWPFQGTPQPWRGIGLNILAIVLGFIMYYFYKAGCNFVTGGLPGGGPDYVFELWLASALLGMTFPIMTVYSNFLNFWPFTEPEPGPEGVSEAAAPEAE
jgi:hypothetical protein